MLALFLLILVPVIMWCGQSVLLLAAGLPIRIRISSTGLPPRLQSVNRTITYIAFAAVLVAYPALRGESTVRYYMDFFPLTGRYAFFHGILVSALYLAALYLGWVVTDNVRFEIRHRTAKLVRRLLLAPVSAVFGAMIEELLFRALLLAGLLESFSTPVAVAVGAIVFAAAHYIRRVKRHWTFAGHIGLGLLLCTAFVCTRALWLPIGLHAGGILLITSFRPFLRYTGPGWLVGVSIFPYAGATGIVALMLLTLNIWIVYGG